MFFLLERTMIKKMGTGRQAPTQAGRQADFGIYTQK
jgi:hypothetical protein